MSDGLLTMPLDDLVDLIQSLDPKASKQDASLLFEAVNKLAKRDAGRALTVALTIRPGVCTPYFFRNLVDSDPKSVVKWVTQDGLQSKESRNIAILSLRELAHSHPELAQGVLSESNPDIQKKFGAAILSELAKDNLGDALQAAANFPPEIQAQAFKAALNGGSVTDPPGAFSEIAKLGNASVAAKVYPNLFAYWFSQDVSSASKALAGLPAADIQNVLTSGNDNLSKLVNADPNLAISILDKVIMTDANSSMFLGAVKNLAQKDASIALTWLREFPDSPNKGQLMREVAIARAQSDPATEVPTILKEVGAYRLELVDGLATAWGNKNPAEAMEYAQNLSSKEQEVFAPTVLKLAIKSDPIAAAGFIAKSNLGTEVRNSTAYVSAVRSTGFSLASADIQKAVQWSNSLSGKEREAAVSGVASQWAERDPSATSEWINSLPSGAVRSAAILSLVKQIEKSDPDSARKWRELVR